MDLLDDFMFKASIDAPKRGPQSIDFDDDSSDDEPIV